MTVRAWVTVSVFVVVPTITMVTMLITADTIHPRYDYARPTHTAEPVRAARYEPVHADHDAHVDADDVYDCTRHGWNYRIALPNFDMRIDRWRRERTIAMRNEGVRNEVTALCGYGFASDINARPQLMVDVGANIGLSMLPYASLGWNVIAFEPVPRNVEFLRYNVRINNFTDLVRVVHGAVSDTARGRVVMWVPLNREDNAAVGTEQSATATTGVENRVYKFDVSTYTLDDMRDMDNVGFLKIDVQGHELNVLRGAHDTIRGMNAASEIVLEYSQKLQTAAGHNRQLLEYVAGAGYELWCGKRPVPPRAVPPCNDVRLVRPEDSRVECPFVPPASAGGDGSGGGGWTYTDELISREHVVFDPGLATHLVTAVFAQNDTVVDIGAGVGQLGAVLRDHSADVTWRGYDGGSNIQDYYNRRVRPRGSTRRGYIMPRVCWIDAADRLAPAKVGIHTWVVSIEVGAHIPKTDEPAFISNLAAMSGHGIIVSWAVPGQGGYGHINERSNEYLISKFQKLGFIHDVSMSLAARDAVRKHAWLRNTLMVLFKSRCKETFNVKLDWPTENIGNALVVYFGQIATAVLAGCDVNIDHNIKMMTLPTHISYSPAHHMLTRTPSTMDLDTSDAMWQSHSAPVLHYMSPLIHTTLVSAVHRHARHARRDAVMVHFRCSDGPMNGHWAYTFLKYKYYIRALNIANVRPPATITLLACDSWLRKGVTSPCRAYAKHIKSVLEAAGYRVRIACGSIEADFSRMVTARVLISGGTGSSMAYMAALASTNVAVLPAPRPAQGVEPIVLPVETMRKNMHMLHWPGIRLEHDLVRDYTDTDAVHAQLVHVDAVVENASDLGIIILSARGSIYERNVARETWMKHHTHAWFMVGNMWCDRVMHDWGCSKKAKPLPRSEQLRERAMQLALKKEDRVVLLPMMDTYRNLPLKLLRAYEWIQTHHPQIKWILKLDLDMYVLPATVLLELRRLEASRDIGQHAIIGNIAWKWTPHKGGKWKEINYKKKHYPPFPVGSSGHIVSRSLVHYLAKQTHELRMYQGEDTSLGIWVDESPLRNNVTWLTLSPMVRTGRGRLCTCTPPWFVTHNLAPKHFKQCHATVRAQQGACDT